MRFDTLNEQPITVPVRAAIDQTNGEDRYIFVGTGKRGMVFPGNKPYIIKVTRSHRLRNSPARNFVRIAINAPVKSTLKKACGTNGQPIMAPIAPNHFTSPGPVARENQRSNNIKPKAPAQPNKLRPRPAQPPSQALATSPQKKPANT